jgi:hypothetical protein
MDIFKAHISAYMSAEVEVYMAIQQLWPDAINRIDAIDRVSDMGDFMDLCGTFVVFLLHLRLAVEVSGSLETGEKV